MMSNEVMGWVLKWTFQQYLKIHESILLTYFSWVHKDFLHENVHFNHNIHKLHKNKHNIILFFIFNILKTHFVYIFLYKQF